MHDAGDLNEADLLQGARDTLRMWTQSDLRHDDLVSPVKYVTAPCGRLILNVSAEMLDAVDCAMHIPDEHSPAIELSVTLDEFEAIGGAESNSDRWKIYHGAPEAARWAIVDIDMARYRGAILDGDAIRLANPLAAVEPRICGLLNREHAEDVRSRISTTLQMEPEDPRVVGVDARGLDIRNRFDIVRMPFPTTIDNPAEAQEKILLLITGKS